MIGGQPAVIGNDCTYTAAADEPVSHTLLLGEITI